jgi:glycosyltransferase involved in cell wall biosynthesis
MKHSLIIYGAFGKDGLKRAVKDWSHAVVYENDARLPAGLRHQVAAVISPEVTYPAEVIARLNRRMEELLDAFLDERAPVPELETGRLFRSACMSMDVMRQVMPHLRTLEEAKLVDAHGPWQEMIISPGSGVCIKAWEQVARHLGVPVRALGLDEGKPSALWMLRRRWQRWLHQRGKTSKRHIFKLPEAVPGDEWLCVDPRVDVILGEEGAAAGWRRAPAFVPPSDDRHRCLRESYLKWWEGWRADWDREHLSAGSLSDHQALHAVGEWAAGDVYPLHAFALIQAREHLRRLKPKRLLVGSMFGKVELMWLVAAKELGIEVGAYSLDNAIYPKLCFAPDFLFYDDLRQRVFAEERGVVRNKMVPVRTHRLPAAAQKVEAPSKRPLVVLADTSYHGVNSSPAPMISFWALETMVEAARLLPGWDFAFKFHPVRERPEARFNFDGCHHRHICERELHFQSLRPPANIRITAPEVRFSDLMATADVVLHIYSYAAIEAMAASIPAFLLASRNDDPDVFWRVMREGEVLPLANNAETLAHKLEELAGDDALRQQMIDRQKRFLADFYPAQGISLAEATKTQWPATVV